MAGSVKWSFLSPAQFNPGAFRSRLLRGEKPFAGPVVSIGPEPIPSGWRRLVPAE